MSKRYKNGLWLALFLSTCCAAQIVIPLQPYEKSTRQCGQIASINANPTLPLSEETQAYGVICEPQASIHNAILSELVPLLAEDKNAKPPITLAAIRKMLQQEASLNPNLINKVLTTVKCTDEYHIAHNEVLAIIDYSLPSSEKRLWVFDLKNKALLFHTYVSHGIRSGALLSNYFSNKYNSKASSMGVFKTDQVYYGRHGLSLKLEGLEHGFNDNAANRSVVMHGGWYVEEDFIKKYGRAGRSWGCPAVPEQLTQPIINTIKDDTLFVVYYPNEHWFLKSKFLRCDTPVTAEEKAKQLAEVQLQMVEKDARDNIIYADLRHNNTLNDSDPILVISADDYSRIFHSNAPLERMLRRQIDNVEYVALSDIEFTTLLNASKSPDGKTAQPNFDMIHFVVPEIKMEHGYYATEMKFVHLGKIVNASPSDTASSSYTLHCNEKTVISLKTTHQFIRWVGL